ncbi:MAG: ABC transporter substrate-binding protein, partial [Lachnospiraceae bacterium]|nr:ABC transporter substrate-binding protein [Lachnospiraceae bacterium]
MWKRTIITIISMCMLYLMACGAKEIETGEAVTDKNNIDIGTEVLGESTPEELTGELVIMSWLPFNNWEQVIEDFTAEHPGVTVTVDMPKQEELLTAEFMERYTTRIMTGEGFDLVESDFVNMEKCAEQDVFADLYELINADNDFHREDYFSCIFETAEMNGKLPAFVYNVRPAYIHLNKRLLERAGIEYTKDTITFKELYE